MKAITYEAGKYTFKTTCSYGLSLIIIKSSPLSISYEYSYLRFFSTALYMAAITADAQRRRCEEIWCIPHFIHLYEMLLVGVVGIEPTMFLCHGFTARCLRRSAHTPVLAASRSRTWLVKKQDGLQDGLT